MSLMIKEFDVNGKLASFITQVSGDININNQADNEDLKNIDNVIKFADKEYNASQYSGLGRIYLRKNIIDGKNILSQDMISSENTIYIIQYDYDLNSAEITIPVNCVLKFEGGIFRNGEIVLNKTTLQTDPTHIFDNIILKGMFNTDTLLLEWFGAKGDGITDDTQSWILVKEYLKNNGGTLILLNKVYAMQPLNLIGLKNISIQGNGFSRSPWKITTCIKIISDGEVGIRCTGEYQEEPIYDDSGNIVSKGQVPTEYATAVLLKDFYLDCNSKVYKGINCNYNVDIQNVEVRYSLGDGIVLEAQTYPVRLFNVQTFYNKKDGVRVVAHNTTKYHIDGLETAENDGYGLHIEGGHCISAKNVTIQSNKRGGMLLKQRNNNEFKYGQWLGYLLFDSLYTEANGTLSEDDVMYDGNYAVKCIGITADRLFTDKIHCVTFMNSNVLASSTGQTSLIEGVSNLKLLNSSGFSIDWTKNIEYAIGTTRTSSLMIGDYGNVPLKKYNECVNEKFYIEPFSASESIKTDLTIFNIQIIGNTLRAHGIIKYHIDGQKIDEFIKFRLLNNKYKILLVYSEWTIGGHGYIESTESGVTYRKEVIIEIEPYGSNFYLKDSVGKYIYPSELPSSGNIKLNLEYLVSK